VPSDIRLVGSRGLSPTAAVPVLRDFAVAPAAMALAPGCPGEGAIRSMPSVAVRWPLLDKAVVVNSNLFGTRSARYLSWPAVHLS